MSNLCTGGKKRREGKKEIPCTISVACMMYVIYPWTLAWVGEYNIVVHPSYVIGQSPIYFPPLSSALPEQIRVASPDSALCRRHKGQRLTRTASCSNQHPAPRATSPRWMSCSRTVEPAYQRLSQLPRNEQETVTHPSPDKYIRTLRDGHVHRMRIVPLLNRQV